MSVIDQYMDQILEIRHKSPEEERDLCLKLLELGDTEYSRAFAHTYLADAFHSMGMLNRALEEYHEATELLRENESDKLALTLQNLAGVIYIALDDEQGALDCFFREIKIAEQQDDYMMCAVALANISYVYRNCGAFDKAEQTLIRAREMAKMADENTSNVSFGAEVYHMLMAGIKLEMEEPDQALKHLEVLHILRQDPLEVPLLYASCYAQKGDKEAAFAQLQPVLTSVEYIRNRFERLSHYFDILDILLCIEDYDTAQKVVQKGEELLLGMESAGKWSRLMDYEIQIYTALNEEKKRDRAYELFFEYDMKFKENTKKAAVKRLKKRLELQKESELRDNIEARMNVLYKRSEYDELTGVFNRRGIRKHMRQAFEQARERKNKFAVLIVDVDFFKEFNDTYGHIAGDTCLKKIAGILQSQVEGKEMAGRYGGDEFLLTVAESDTISVMELALEIKQKLEEAAIPNEKSTVSEFVTVTIGGINTVPDDVQKLEDYIEEADRILYRLKKNSKNGFSVAESFQGD